MGCDQSEHPAKTTMTGTALIIRADASVQIGSGHVMRCLALAQAWQDQGGTVTFVSDMPGTLQDRLHAEEIAVCALTTAAGSQEDAKQLIAVAEELNSHHVVVDGYHFGADYQKQIKDAGLRALVLDDNGHADHYYADLVLNQNIHAHENLYANREPYTQLLLGTRYALLRREFWQWREWRRTIPATARKILVTMGGSDPDNVSLKVLIAIEHMQSSVLEVKVAIGGSNPHYQSLLSAALASVHNIQLERAVTDMPALMTWVDIAISAGGSTCWELAFMGLPSVSIVLANNQIASAHGLDKQGVVINLGDQKNLTCDKLRDTVTYLLENADLRTNMASGGRELIDSRGGKRVVKALKQTELDLRPISSDDCRLIFDWANEPSVRNASFSSSPISWETHVAWFERALNDENLVLWIAENNLGIPVGQVRFTLEHHEATISISLDHAHRGKGYGVELIKQASTCILDQYDVNIVHAYIKTDNIGSVQAFANAGFSSAPPVQINNQPALHMTLERS